MAFQYDSVVPWGRSFDEYRRMFALTDAELGLKIIGCADGPASFNAEMNALGHAVVSADPLYQFSAAQIRQRICETYQDVISQTEKNRDLFVWTRFSSVDELARARLASMEVFLSDFDRGKAEGRYVTAELPGLPFASKTFDLLLCSHFLFLYSPILTLEFHEQALLEMCRVAKEVRVFPLLTFDAKPSPHIQPVMKRLNKAGPESEVVSVDYEFQKGGNEMMRICSLKA